MIDVRLSAGEFLQYLLSSPFTNLHFSLVDINTKEVILSDSVPATYHAPPTFTRLWPVVGDRPQRESSLQLVLGFPEVRHHCTFQVQHRRSDGSWRPVIDMDFEALERGASCAYSFSVLAD